MFLHEQSVRARPVHRDPVNAVADLGSRIGDVLRREPAIDRLPRLAAVI